jgi:hypothetical protein
MDVENLIRQILYFIDPQDPVPIICYYRLLYLYCLIGLIASDFIY